MRIHLTACAFVLYFASQLSLSRGEMACLLLAIGMVMSAELLNTAVEKLCDFNQKSQNRYIRVIKDMAAGAVLLAAVALLPGRADWAANVVVSYVCAIQAESFRKFNGNVFATTMCTGNLRSGTERLHQFWQTGDRDQGLRAAQYYGIVLFFIAGAALGAWCAGLWGRRAVLAACAPLVLALLLMFQRARPAA